MAVPVKVLCVGSGPALKIRVAVLQQHHLEATGCAPEQVRDVLAYGLFDVVLLPADIERKQLLGIREKSHVTAIVCREDFIYPADLVELIKLAKSFNR